MKQLIHNGVLVPKYEEKNLCIIFREKKIELSPEQEEAAVAWVKKLGTEYVKDKTFAKNFFNDFTRMLNKEGIKHNDLDFSEIQQYVLEEKNRKLAMSKEDRKQLAQERKIKREANREKFGYAIVDGLKVEVSNYTVEPTSIFMGRGRHPLRGRYKCGAQKSDIILNLSSEAPIPKGNWKSVVWQPNSMWIAKWRDKLQGKWKYVWLSDTSYVKQKRDIEKFEKALELEEKIEKVRAYTLQNLSSPSLLRRKIATVCYLIDILKLRVGDEKDRDEADTVGATTLRSEHISFGHGSSMTFDFLGKDSIRWHFNVELPKQVLGNIRCFSNNAKSSIFKGVRSDNVSAFLDEIMPGLTAKVFRTYHATRIVRRKLAQAKVSNEAPDFIKKRAATIANLEAAKACNHKKKIRNNWNESLGRMKERLKKTKLKKHEIKTKKTRKKDTKIRRLKKIDDSIRKLKTRIELKKATLGYNLNTSLKSYIDPRIYFVWGTRVEYDWKKYYPKSLQRKFIWVEEEL